MQVAAGGLQAADGAGALWIGGAESVNEYFGGQIDEVRVHDRALTQAEIGYLAAGNGPPEAPGTPVLTPGIGQIDLAWTASPTASPTAPTYSVYSGDTADSVATPEADGLTATVYTDAVPSGTTLFYAVAAVNFAGEGPRSGAAGAASLFPEPRTNDHDEGLFDDRCSCGSSVGASAPAAGAVLLALLLAAGGCRGRRPAWAAGRRTPFTHASAFRTKRS